jgi:hypothetical protein
VSWDAPKGPKRYRICYEVEQGDKKIRETCFQYDLPNGNGGKVTWDTGAAFYAKVHMNRNACRRAVRHGGCCAHPAFRQSSFALVIAVLRGG